jgi:hypothetical protein
MLELKKDGEVQFDTIFLKILLFISQTLYFEMYQRVTISYFLRNLNFLTSNIDIQ